MNENLYMALKPPHKTLRVHSAKKKKKKKKRGEHLEVTSSHWRMFSLAMSTHSPVSPADVDGIWHDEGEKSPPVFPWFTTLSCLGYQCPRLHDSRGDKSRHNLRRTSRGLGQKADKRPPSFSLNCVFMSAIVPVPIYTVHLFIFSVIAVWGRQGGRFVLGARTESECINGRHPPSKPPVGVCCPRHAGVKGNADRANLISGLLLGRSEMLRSLRHHTIDRLEEKGVKRGSARRYSLGTERERERAIYPRPLVFRL